jgi:hypothetical protein
MYLILKICYNNIVRLRTKTTEFSFSLIYNIVHVAAFTGSLGSRTYWWFLACEYISGNVMKTKIHGRRSFCYFKFLQFSIPNYITYVPVASSAG